MNQAVRSAKQKRTRQSTFRFSVVIILPQLHLSQPSSHNITTTRPAMTRLGLRQLLFALGFCFGLHLWAFCSQLIVLLVYSFVVFLLLCKVQGLGDQEKQVDIEMPRFRLEDVACSRQPGTSAGKKSTSISSSAQSATLTPATNERRQEYFYKLSGISVQDRLNQLLAHQPPTRPKLLSHPRYGTKASRWESMLESAQHFRTSNSECSMQLKASRSKRRMPIQSAFLSRAQRAAILAWLRDVVPEEPHVNSPDARPTTPPAAVMSPILPLTTRRLCYHLVAAGDTDQCHQARFHTSDLSSSSGSMAYPPVVQSRSSTIPVKRTIACNDSSPDFVFQTLRMTKMPKTDVDMVPELPAPANLQQSRMSSFTRFEDNDQSFNTFSDSSYGDSRLFASRDTSQHTSARTEHDMDVQAEPSAAPSGKRRLGEDDEEAQDEIENSRGPVQSQAQGEAAKQNHSPVHAGMLHDDLNQSPDEVILGLLARLNE